VLLVISKFKVIRVAKSLLSILNLKTSPSATAVVHPVRVVSVLLLAAVSVGIAAAVIVSATVGGKFA